MFLLGRERSFPVMIQASGFVRLKTFVSNHGREWMDE